MKKFLVYIALLVSSTYQAVACGYSPYGEDVRYCLFLPSYFDYSDFQAFQYNADLFGFHNEHSKGYESNVIDWYQFMDKKVSIASINEFMNESKLTDIREDSDDAFIVYLYKTKATGVLQYLTLAKKSETINAAEIYDAWERNDDKIAVNRSQFLKDLVNRYEKEKNIFLKRKYAFLAIRVAYYGKDFKQINTLFDKEFKNGKKDYLYYWSLYFDCFAKENPFVQIANIMANSAEKREATYYYFHELFEVEKALSTAQNNQEKANVLAYASVQRVDKNLDYLREIYKNDPKSRMFSFLILREINKIEDWVYTPYYTNYVPSVIYVNSYWQGSEVATTNLLRERSEKDRLYALELLDFVNTISLTTVENPILMKASRIQLLFITKKYVECLSAIQAFESQHKDEKVFEQIQKIKALCLISNQEMNKAIIPDAAQAIILKYQSDTRFLFALGRELEFLNNKEDGLALISLSNPKNDYHYAIDNVEWQGNRLATSGNLKVFYNYFDYLDFVYPTKDLQRIVDRLKTDFHSDFERKIYGSLLKDKEQLSDLLGTKYIRENNLTQAYSVFKSMGAKYWDDNYNAWERGTLDEYYAFEENPFYDFKYTPNFIEKRDSFLVTKLSVTQHLIQYLNLANNPKTKNRDYYYFLVANCYFNMSQFGHSWMMRRFSSTFEYYENESYIDQLEYQQAKIAQHYYDLAYRNAKTDKFKALCLRMKDYAKGNYVNVFVNLRKNYPEYSEALSNCENLEEFFNAR